MKATIVKSLFDICLDTLADNQALLSTLYSGSQDDVSCSDYDQVLPNDVVEKLLYKLSEKRKLDDKTLLSTVQAKHTTLKHVQIPDASRLTVMGLRTLKSHRLSSLSVCQCYWLSLGDIMSCLGPDTWKSLRELRCAGALKRWRTFPLVWPDEHTLNIFRRLVNIRFLALVDMNISDGSLHIIAESLPNLRYLDISRNMLISDISPLRDVQLHTLIMYGLYNLATDITVETLQQLNNLKHLDVSLRPKSGYLVSFAWADRTRFCAKVLSNSSRFYLGNFLKCPSSNPKLKSLDLSGRSDVSQELLRAYVEEHPSLDFLGLWGSQACGYSMFDVKSKDYKPGIDVSGDASLDQYAVSLRRHPSYKWSILDCLCGFVQRCHEGWTMTSENDKILKSLLEVISRHSVWEDCMWEQTNLVIGCLHDLLKKRVFHIESDTVKWLLRTCRCLLTEDQPSSGYMCYYNEVCSLATEIVSICKQL